MEPDLEQDLEQDVMPVAEAWVETDRASRYLVQLCQHVRHMGQGHYRPRKHGSGHGTDRGGDHTPPMVDHVEWSDTRGVISLGVGRCELRVEEGALVLRAEARDEEGLRQLQERVAHRLETIGRRDRLKVTWHRPDAPTTQPGEPGSAGPPAQEAAPHRRRRRTITVVGLGAVAVLAVAVHLGLFGGAIAASTWTTWGTSAIVALVLLKLLFVGVHVVSGVLGVRFLKHRGPGHVIRHLGHRLRGKHGHGNQR